MTVESTPPLKPVSPVMLSDKQLSTLSRAARNGYLSWTLGLPLGSKSTTHRLRREILDAYGIDVVNQRPGPTPAPPRAEEGHYYTIAIAAETVPGVTNFAAHWNDRTTLGPNGRVAADDSCAYIASRDLAREFAEARLPKLRELYGPDTQYTIDEHAYPIKPNSALKYHAKMLARIERDTERVMARLKQQQFAPNVRPANIKKS